MRPNRAKMSVCAIALAVTSTTLGAVPTVFIGADSGVESSDPRPLSDAAAAAFNAAVSGETIITFEGAPLGTFSNLVVVPGVTIDGVGFSGSDQTIRNGPIASAEAVFGYNTTAGGTEFVYLFEGDLTFTFATPIQAFGAYITGGQGDAPGVGPDTISFNDGTAQVITIPGGISGGAVFAGFTDFGAQISSITFNVGLDYVGVDDVRFVSAIPEPATLTLLGFGLAIIGFSSSRKSN